MQACPLLRSGQVPALPRGLRKHCIAWHVGTPILFSRIMDARRCRCRPSIWGLALSRETRTLLVQYCPNLCVSRNGKGEGLQRKIGPVFLFQLSKESFSDVPRHHKRNKRPLFRVVLEMETLGLDKLIESEPAQRLTQARVLPSGPCEILEKRSVRGKFIRGVFVQQAQ